MDHQLAINIGIIQNSQLKSAFVTYEVKNYYIVLCYVICYMLSYVTC